MKVPDHNAERHTQGQHGGEPPKQPADAENVHPHMPADEAEALRQQAGGTDPNDPKLGEHDAAGRDVVTDAESAGTKERQESERATAGNDGGSFHDAGNPAAQAYRAPDVHSATLTDAMEGERHAPGERPTIASDAGVPVVAHTPTMPLGQHQVVDPRAAQPVTNYPPQPNGPLQPASAEAAAELRKAAAEGRSATIEVSQMAPGPGEATARTNRGLEVAAPAPVPSPQDPDLTAGTVDAFIPEGRPGQTEPD